MYLNSFAIKYNRLILTMLAIAPFAAFIFFSATGSEYMFLIQLMSYVGVVLLLIFRINYNPIIFPRYLFFYLLFVLYVFYSTFVLLDREFKMQYLMSNPIIGSFNIMFIIENITIDKKQYRWIIKISKRVLIAAILVILYQEAVDVTFFLRTDTDVFERATSVFGKTQNRLLSIYSWVGDFLAIGYGFVPVFLIIIEDLIKQKKKVLIWLLAGIIFAFLSKQRWIMVNTILVFFILIVHQKDKLKQILKLMIFVPIIYLGSVTILDAVGLNATGIINDRILESDKKKMNQKVASTRLLAFESFDRFFWDQPLFGIGDIKYGMGGIGKHDYKLQRFLNHRSAQIHVGYLSLLYKFGIIGGFLFLGFQYLFLKKMLRIAKRTKYWAPFLCFVGYALGNFTQVHFAIFYMGLLIALFAEKYYQLNPSTELND